MKEQSTHGVMKPLGKAIQTQEAALEALFAQELPGGKDAVIAPRLAEKMQAEGLIDYREMTIGSDAFGGIRIGQHFLTIRGHMLYCESCKD